MIIMQQIDHEKDGLLDKFTAEGDLKSLLRSRGGLAFDRLPSTKLRTNRRTGEEEGDLPRAFAVPTAGSVVNFFTLDPCGRGKY